MVELIIINFINNCCMLTSVKRQNLQIKRESSNPLQKCCDIMKHILLSLLNFVTLENDFETKVDTSNNNAKKKFVSLVDFIFKILKFAAKKEIYEFILQY